MFIKIAGNWKANEPWLKGFTIFETQRVHYYRATWGHVIEQKTHWDWCVSASNDTDKETVPERDVIILNFPFGLEQQMFTAIFDTVAYILNDDGKTIERLRPGENL